jgi:soluble lytic murein transglycosylase-like protein
VVALACATAGLASPASAQIYAFADARGEVLLTDAPQGGAWRMLFMLEEAGARTMPPAGEPVRGCPAPRGPATGAAWHGELDAIARAHGLDPHLVSAVIWAESRCDPRAVSPKGAAGLMQLMPATARAYGVADVFDPLQNMRGGARYLRDLVAMFPGKLDLALAAYNAGPRSVIDARMRVPPFRETRAYVPAVLSRMEASMRASTARAPRQAAASH